MEWVPSRWPDGGWRKRPSYPKREPVAPQFSSELGARRCRGGGVSAVSAGMTGPFLHRHGEDVPARLAQIIHRPCSAQPVEVERPWTAQPTGIRVLHE